MGKNSLWIKAQLQLTLSLLSVLFATNLHANGFLDHAYLWAKQIIPTTQQSFCIKWILFFCVPQKFNTARPQSIVRLTSKSFWMFWKLLLKPQRTDFVSLFMEAEWFPYLQACRSWRFKVNSGKLSDLEERTEPCFLTPGPSKKYVLSPSSPLAIYSSFLLKFCFV